MPAGPVAASPAAPNSPPSKSPPQSALKAGWPNGVAPTDEFRAAYDHLREGKGHLFVTGRAGTGKSTLLKCVRDLLEDKMVVVAPTGLAAVNVGGQTIHSFFGLPPRLIRKDDIRKSRNARIMRGLKFLVIDEVSMVRSDIMWAIDQSLRVNRGRAREPFGGVRLAMFGDLHQLPPVIDEGEVAAHLETEHGGPFFFDVGALREGHGTALIELNQVFRQKDEALIGVLNKVRDGDAGEDDLAVLNERVHPIRTLSEGEPYVILVPTNAAARRINAAYLEALTGRPETYQAGVTGEFNESAQPTDATLVLKPGAKVMMLRNDTDRRWVNGTIARVSQAGVRQGVGGGGRRGARGGARVVGEPPLRLRQRRRDDRRDRGRHLQAVPAQARLGAHHPQEPGPHARQGLHRSGPRHLRPRPGLRGAVRAAARWRAWRWPARCAPPTSCSTRP